MGAPNLVFVASRAGSHVCAYGCIQRDQKTACAKDLLIRLAQKQAESAAAFGWIATKGNSRHDQVRAGRAYERVHLTATSQDLSLHAISPILESYPGMEVPAGKLRNLLGIPDTHTVQMLFRLGYSNPGSPSKRRVGTGFCRVP